MSAGHNRLISGFLFTSGATGLAYEVLWSKHLGNLLGNSGEAHAVVLATFLGGLALGAWALGGAADRARRPLALYGVLELLTAAYALAFPALLGALGEAYAGAAPSLGPGAKGVARVAISGAALLPPALLMGGTLPAMVKHFAADLAGARREVARLYAVNSLGAAAGVFVAGVALVPALGLLRTGWLAAGVNAALGVGALALGWRGGQAAPAVAETAPDDAATKPTAPGSAAAPAQAMALAPATAPELAMAPECAGARSPLDAQAEPRRPEILAALAGAAISGFTAMLYELGWIRVLSIVLGASAYAFTLILTAFILGIALGSFWLASRRWSVPPLRAFGWLQVALAVSACAAGPIAVRLPYWFYRAQAGMARSLDTWPWYQALTFACCLAVLVVPAFFLGASFPAAAQVAGRRLERFGRQLGTTYLWNTAGSISGALFGGLWLLPAIGLERCFALGVASNAAAALLALSAGERRRRAWVPAAVGLSATLVAFLGGGWGTFLANGSTLRMRGAPPPSFAGYRALVEQGALVRFRADDTFATVLVAESPSPGGGPPHRMMKINGKVDASNGADAETQVLAGHLGVLLHPREVDRALVIGAGAAITAGSVLAHPLESLDMVEISPAVLEAARLFAGDNRRALEDPRTRVYVDDAKTFLAGARERKYDLVVSVPSNPWVSGVSGLFTREFFRAVAANLAEDGVLVQWIHTYESDEPLIRLVMRTMRETFPHATTWVGPQDLVMVASRAPLRPDFARLSERMARPAARADLERISVGDPFTLLAKQVHSDAAQRELAGEGPLNTDDLNLLEYASPVAFFLRRDFVPVRDERRAPGGGGRLWLSSYLGGRAPSAAELEGLYRNASRFHAPDDPWVRSVAEAWRAGAPDSPRAAAAVSRAALAQRDVTAALESCAPWVERGERSPELVSAYLRAVAERVWSRRSVVLPDAAPVEVALRAGREALGLKPADPEVEEALGRLCRALPDGACAGPSSRKEAVFVPSSH